jgi:phosphatidylglycerophosphate synthase
LNREDYLDRWSALHGGYDVDRSRLVRGWLGMLYALARPLAAAGTPPDLVTLAGLLLAVIAAVLAWAGVVVAVLLAALAVLLSGLVDGLDGAVAVLSGRTSRWGYVLDSVTDRIGEGAYLVALYVLGAPGWLCVGAGAVSYLQEYVRARAGAAGMTEIGVVTVAERPTRVIVTAVFLTLAALAGTGTCASAGAGVWLALGIAGLGQILVVARRRLAEKEK